MTGRVKTSKLQALEDLSTQSGMYTLKLNLDEVYWTVLSRRVSTMGET